MQVLLSVFYFIGVLSVLVIVHEWGHFVAAKMCGMRVSDFSLFFGKRIWRIGERNGTEYNIRSIPLGGFVKIEGMEPEDISNGAPLIPALRHGKRSQSIMLIGLDSKALERVNEANVSPNITTLVVDSIGEDSRLTEVGIRNLREMLYHADLNEDEKAYLTEVLASESYTPDPSDYNQKPIPHRAWAIFAGPLASLVFGYFLICFLGVTYGFGVPDNSVGGLLKGKPAEKAGLKLKDKITEVNGNRITEWEQLVKIIHASPNKPLQLRVKRGEQALTITATPDSVTEGGKTEGRLGFMPGAIPQRQSLGDAFTKGTLIFMRQIGSIAQIFSKPKEIRDNVGGPIAIASLIHQSGGEGIHEIIFLAAGLSVSLGVLNLLPIPILDGGHLLLLGIEALRRRKLSTKEVYTAQLFGLSVIGMLFVFVMYNDLSRIFLRK
jgi:regulator of sigma E protease